MVWENLENTTFVNQSVLRVGIVNDIATAAGSRIMPNYWQSSGDLAVGAEQDFLKRLSKATANDMYLTNDRDVSGGVKWGSAGFVSGSTLGSYAQGARPLVVTVRINNGFTERLAAYSSGVATNTDTVYTEETIWTSDSSLVDVRRKAGDDRYLYLYTADTMRWDMHAVFYQGFNAVKINNMGLFFREDSGILRNAILPAPDYISQSVTNLISATGMVNSNFQFLDKLYFNFRTASNAATHIMTLWVALVAKWV